MKKNNTELLKIIISIIPFFISFFMREWKVVYLLLLIISYAIISYELYIHAFHNIKEKEFFDENILMILATIGAFCIGEYVEAILVVLLFQIGEYLSDIASDRTKDSIIDLMDLRSDTTHLIKGKKVETVKTNMVEIGDIFEVRPGETIPLDGNVLEGESLLDTSSLTGESIPRRIESGETVLSGMQNLTGLLKVRATSTYVTSTASKIIELMEHSNDRKTKTEKFITRFSKIYTPIVVLLAFLIIVISLLFEISIEDSLYQSLVFLVMSCPCALVISVPLGFFQGIGRCSKEHILVKGSNELDGLTAMNAIALDKTGTITEGNFQVTEVNCQNKLVNLLEIAAHCEAFSNHPIAKSIMDSYHKKIDKSKVSSFKEISGKGITAKYKNVIYYIGNEKLMAEQNKKTDYRDTIGTMIHISNKDEYLGNIIISDKIKKNIRQTIAELEKLGIKKVVILSGDNKKMVEAVSEKVGIKDFYDSLLPQDKVIHIQRLAKDYRIAFVGDGMNDAPVMKCADIGISMGGLGSDIAIEASDIVLMKDDLSKIPTAIRIARLTKKIVKYNIILVITTKIIVLLLGLFGLSSIWLAILADVGVTLLSVLNTFIIQKKKLGTNCI